MHRYLIYIFIFTVSTLYGQEQDTVVNKIDIRKNLQEVIITGQISPKLKENAVQKIKVIGSQELGSGVFINLADVLAKEINIRINQDNILGSGVSLQGISGQNVKILIDEIPVIGRLDGNIDLSQINLTNVERIEIVEGPLSVDYGTDALAGTINIITKKEYLDPSIINFNSYYETVGRYNNNLLFTKSFNNISSSYELARNYFSGWSEGEKFSFLPQSELADTNRFKTWKPKEQIFNKIQISCKEKKYNARAYFEHFYEKITNRGFPRSPYFETAFDDFYYTYRTNFGTDLDYKLSKSDFKILLAYNHYKRVKNTYFNDLTTLNTNLITDASSQDTSVFQNLISRVVMSSYYNDNLHYHVGIDMQKESANGERLKNNFQQQSDYALFSNIEYLINKKIMLKPGLRLIYNTQYVAPIIPSFNILYDLDFFKIRSSYARGFRAPTLKELFLDFVDINHNIIGNSELLAEESNNYRLNLDYFLNREDYRFVFDITVFYNEINNKIDLLSTMNNTSQYTYFNISEYKTKGISSNIKLSNTNIIMNVGFSSIGRYNNILDQSSNFQESLKVISNNDFIYSQELNASTFINFKSDLALNIFYKYTGSTPYFFMDNNDNLVENTNDSYHSLDASINKDFTKYGMQLSLGVKNLFNVTSISRLVSNSSMHSSTSNSLNVGYGRSFFATININL